MIALEHAPLLGREREPVALAMQRVDPAEQRLVHEDLVPVLGAQRRDLALDLQDRVVGVGAGERIEDVVDTRERVAAQFQRLDGIGEGRRGGIGRDGGDLGLVLGEGAREGRPEVLGPYPLERRHPERPGPVLEERVFATIGSGKCLVLLIHVRHMGYDRFVCTSATGRCRVDWARPYLLIFPM